MKNTEEYEFKLIYNKANKFAEFYCLSLWQKILFVLRKEYERGLQPLTTWKCPQDNKVRNIKRGRNPLDITSYTIDKDRANEFDFFCKLPFWTKIKYILLSRDKEFIKIERGENNLNCRSTLPKILPLILIIFLTSCSIKEPPPHLQPQSQEIVLHTTKENNPYLQGDWVDEDIYIASNPLPKLKNKPKIIYFHTLPTFITAMAEVVNNDYRIIGGYKKPAYGLYRFRKGDKNLEEAGILMGADLLLFGKMGIMFISTK